MKDILLGLLFMVSCLLLWMVLFLNDANNELLGRESMLSRTCPTQKLCEPVIKVEKPEQVIVYKETVKRDCPPCEASEASEASEVCDYSIYNERIDALEKKLKEALLQLKLNCR